MKNKKKVLLDVHMFEIDSLCDYFHDMAKHGWLLITLSSNAATFQKIKPTNMYFYIALSQRYSYFDSETNISETDKEFAAFVESYGWYWFIKPQSSMYIEVLRKCVFLFMMERWIHIYKQITNKWFDMKYINLSFLLLFS